MEPEDLNELERRLSGWKPVTEGLDVDRMLYAAGRASTHPLRSGAMVAGLGLLVILLAGWLAIERAERLALSQQLKQAPAKANPAPMAAPGPASPPSGATSPATREEQPADDVLADHRLLEEEMASNSVLASHRLLDRGLDALLAQP